MARLIKFILPICVFLLSGFVQLSSQDTDSHFNDVSFSDYGNFTFQDASQNTVKLLSSDKKHLGHEDYTFGIEEKEEDEDDLVSFSNHSESSIYHTAFFYVFKADFTSTLSVSNGLHFSESLSSNNKYLLFQVFQI